MIDILIFSSVLVAITIFAAFEYYRQLCKVKAEYEKAKETVEDIVVSFNRQFRQEAERVELLAYKVESTYSKGETALNRAEESYKRVLSLEEKMSDLLRHKEDMSVKLVEVDRKLCDFVASQETLALKVSALEEQARELSAVPEVNVEAVIPIKREKALAPLTETELAVLEMLASEGPKTAPEIKDRIKLSREHTARLMKKLYEGGYLERNTSKIPFKYNVKKEMEEFLKKKESKAA
ncbi:MAG: MarR family transcriptional regulator [Candidatus Bathyarchaeia archaeon]